MTCVALVTTGFPKARQWAEIPFWASRILDDIIDGVSDTVNYQMRQLLSTDRYYRSQVELILAEDDMNDAFPSNLAHLKDQENGRLEAFC